MAGSAKENVAEYADRVLKAEIESKEYVAKHAEVREKFHELKKKYEEAKSAEPVDTILVEVISKKLMLAKLDVVRQIALQDMVEENRKKAIAAFRRMDASTNGTHYGGV